MELGRLFEFFSASCLSCWSVKSYSLQSSLNKPPQVNAIFFSCHLSSPAVTLQNLDGALTYTFSKPRQYLVPLIVPHESNLLTRRSPIITDPLWFLSPCELLSCRVMNIVTRQYFL